MLFYTFNILLFHICIFIFIFRYLSSSILSCGITALPSRRSIFPRPRQPPATHATPRYYSHSTPGSQVRQIKVSQLIKSPSPESRVIIDYNLSGKIVNNVRLGLRAGHRAVMGMGMAHIPIPKSEHEQKSYKAVMLIHSMHAFYC